MEAFLHIKSVIAIILGLSLAHLITGSVSFIQHPGRKKFFLLHFLWVFYIFLMIIHFWWWEFNLKLVTEWFFGDYFFIICYILIFYVICAILYPDDLKDYSGYEEYFYSRKNWFFAMLALCFGADLIDTYIKGAAYISNLGSEYYARNSIHIALCLSAIFIKNKKFHWFLVAGFLIYEIQFILRFFNFE